MSEWWSIEVFDAEQLPARRWKDSYQDELTEAALTNGASTGSGMSTTTAWCSRCSSTSDAQWEAFRALPAVRAALDGVPDPVNGLLVYRGRGGGSGPRKPRKPKPAPGSSAMARPEPEEQRLADRLESPRRGSRSCPPQHEVRRSGSRGRSTRRHGAGWGNEGKSSHDRRPAGGDRAQRLLPGPGVPTRSPRRSGRNLSRRYVVHHDAIFDPGMEVRRHMTVLALTPTRLVYSHTDEHPADDVPTAAARGDQHRGHPVHPDFIGGPEPRGARPGRLRAGRHRPV